MKRAQLLGIAVVAVIVVAAGAYFMKKAPEPGGAAQEAAKTGEHRGGTMRLLAVGAGGSIDPHINYTLQYWQLYQGLYDGLVMFKKGTGEEGFKVVADLAEAIPTATNDGKTWTFKLRKGIKFSDGRDVTIKDVVASLQRIFKVSSPTAGGFYNGIVGADKCLEKPETCNLEGGVIGDEAAGTVTINLVAADPEILLKLAL